MNKHTAYVTTGWSFLRLQEITRADGKPYLRRLLLFKTPWFGIYLHEFLGPDDACTHDHPWPFLSLILWGGYWEFVRNPSFPREELIHHGGVMMRVTNLPWCFPPVWRRIGSVAYRPATHAHCVQPE